MGLFLNMKHQKFGISKIVAIVTATTLLCGCGFFSNKSDTVPLNGRKTVPFSQMEIQEADISNLTTQIQELESKLGEFSDVKQLLEQEEALNENLEVFDTSGALADLQSYLHSSDQQLRQQSEEFSVQSEQLNSYVIEYLRKVMESPLADTYREEMGEYASSQIDRQLATNSPNAVEFMQKRQQLDNQYNEKLSNLRVEVDGKEMRINEVLELPNLTSEQFYQAINDYYIENYEEFANLYLEMIQLDKQAAAACGYEDAVQWRYDSFGRDYTPQQAQQLFAEIKEYIVPWMAEMEYNDGMTLALSEEKGVSTVKKLLQETDPLLKETWNFMEQNELFSLGSDSDKMSGIAFTMPLSAYDAPFVYAYWQGSLRDAFTLVHEFGHAVDNYSQFGNEAYTTDLDKSETFSQGLEQVLQQKLAKAVGADPKQVMQSSWGDMVQTITYQAALEDFQMRAYALPQDAQPMDLAKLFADVLEEYGYYSAFGEYDTTWFEVTHLFDAPFYTMSYVTSATAALELGRMETSQPGSGLEAWLKLVETDRNQSFESFLKEAGIASPFEQGRMQECGEFLKENLVSQQAKAA